MRKIRNLMKMFTGAAMCTVLLMLASSLASATTVDECTNAINVVRATLVGVVIGGNNPDLTRASLDSKLDGAVLKLQQSKFADALVKLTDFRDKILSLQSQGKIADGTTNTMATLLAETNTAISCVNNLIAGV